MSRHAAGPWHSRDSINTRIIAAAPDDEDGDRWLLCDTCRTPSTDEPEED